MTTFHNLLIKAVNKRILTQDEYCQALVLLNQLSKATAEEQDAIKYKISKIVAKNENKLLVKSSVHTQILKLNKLERDYRTKKNEINKLEEEIKLTKKRNLMISTLDKYTSDIKRNELPRIQKQIRKQDYIVRLAKYITNSK